jgi:predicted ester cyclase
LEVISGTSSIATRWTLSGTFQNTYLGHTANGRKISWQGISIIHVNNGLITSVRTIFDTKPFFEALEKPREEK